MEVGMVMDERVADALEREHRAIDAGIAEFYEGLANEELRIEGLSTASQALRRHIFIEEELLFPPLRAAGLYAPVTVMLREHAEIWSLLDELDRPLGASGCGDVLAELCADLERVLEKHNMKEEQILYPQADAIVDAEVKRDVLDQLDRGQLPEGWVCQALSSSGG